MTYYLKILNEVRGSSHLKVNGFSGLLYLFKWDEKARAYVYHPKNQNEVDDLVKTMGRTTSAIFSPVSIPQPAAPAAQPQEQTAPDHKPKNPLKPATIEHCLVRGIVVTEDDDEDVATRLLAAYERGVVAGANVKPAKVRNPAKTPAG